MKTENTNAGRNRAVIEAIYPEIDGGRFAIKRSVGEKIKVEADVFADSHDVQKAVVRYRKDGDTTWHEVPMKPVVNDRWHSEFTVHEVGRHYYTIAAWVDPFESWHHEFERREDEKDIAVALLVAAELADAASGRANEQDAKALKDIANDLRSNKHLNQRRELALSEWFSDLMNRYPDRSLQTIYEKELPLVVDEFRASFSSWYEFFPRSCGPGTQHGTFKDAEGFLLRIANMGFDVVYLPPIHPIGFTARKGKNNTLNPGPDDCGVPWAIGSEAGGHKSIHPELGTLEDFQNFVKKANNLGMEIALDIAFQCSPDHPWVKEHPKWFRWRPDGTVQYAENPPKKYQDIYPINFESEDVDGLWKELKSVFEFWLEQGVHIFRVDNPHTKSFYFWEWCITELKKTHPNAMFLSEAFTRPKVMHRLAKLGYTQSYTYFTWRNNKWEMTEYIKELFHTKAIEYMRPNFWPNTPDILPEYLQFGGRPAFLTRLVLAATLTASYGIYGPAYEVFDNTPIRPGKEEYLHSEKYEIKDWHLDQPSGLRDFITRINWIRQDNPALQSNWNFRFHDIENDAIMCYSKHTEDFSNIILVVVSFDYHNTQGGWLNFPADQFGFNPQKPYRVHDLISGEYYVWNGNWNFVGLNPHRVAAHVFRIEPYVHHTEVDFETYDL